MKAKTNSFLTRVPAFLSPAWEAATAPCIRSMPGRRLGRSAITGWLVQPMLSVVEFGPRVRALSIHTFGASGHPESRHYLDQAPLYARGEFKPAWLTLKDIRANLEAAYRPGEEAKTK